jgi:superfamily II DNA or RNA helicase
MSSLPDLSLLRKWQAEAIEGYLGEPRQDYTVTATPGAGKTTLAITIARHLLKERRIDRIIIVVPTDHLRTQWGQAAIKGGLLLDPTLGNDAILSKEYDGYITTYAQVASHPLLHERRTEAPHRTFVIFDEVHHAGDGLSWGDAVRTAFTSATKRLALTGTPFRTSTIERIPFVRYEEDGDGMLKSVADYTYGYKDALADYVVRPVLFAAYSGVARWRNSAGDVIAADLSDTITKEEEMAAWQTILEPSGDWIPHVIGAASDRLEEIRKAGMKDAGCLILASDQDKAKAYAAVVKSVTGSTPTVVLSEDPKASEKITAFSNNNDKFLVAVRMVSEGVDIPRCAVLVWLTAYRTPLFFAQAVGRVVRAREKGESATVFLPAVRPLLELAADIESQRDHVLKARVEAEGLEAINDSEQNEPGMSSKIESIDASANFAHVLFGGRAVMGSDTLSEEDEEYLGLPGLLSPEQMASTLAKRDKAARAKQKASAPAVLKAVAEVVQHERAAALRKEITKLVNQVAARTGQQQSQIHVQTRRAVPGPANPQASVETLEGRRDWLLHRIS